MRELHAWHGDRHRPAPDAPADVHPRHASDSPRFRVLLDPEVRRAEWAKQEKSVREYEPKHAAGQPKPQETAAELRETGSEAKAALAAVDNRTLPKSSQVKDVAASQKRRVSDKDISYIAMLGSYIVKTAAEYVSAIPPHLASDISGGLLVLAVGIVLSRDKRRKDGNADRPQD